jgi:hypothetical protein
MLAEALLLDRYDPLLDWLRSPWVRPTFTPTLITIRNLAISIPRRCFLGSSSASTTFAVAGSNLSVRTIHPTNLITKDSTHSGNLGRHLKLSPAEPSPRTANLASHTLSVKQWDSQVVLINTA